MLDQIKYHLEEAIKLLSQLETNNIINKDFMTAEEAAKALGLKKSSFQSYRAIGKIKLQSHGRNGRKFKRTDVEEILKFYNALRESDLTTK